RTDRRLEILAVEIRQYAGAAHEFRALVPRVIGATAQAAARKSPLGARRQLAWTEDEFLEVVHETHPSAESIIAQILHWADSHPHVKIEGGRGNYPSLHLRADTLWPTSTYREILSLYAPSDKPWVEIHVKRLGRSMTANAKAK